VSSRDGFARADVDVGFMHDPKIVALARRLRDPERTMVASGIYLAAVLASWHAGRRVTLEEAAPAWFMGDPVEHLGDLVAVGLVDEEGRVVEHAFEAWTARARAASAAARDAARARWHRVPGAVPAAEAEPTDSASTAPESDGTAQPAGLPAGTPAEPARPAAPDSRVLLGGDAGGKVAAVAATPEPVQVPSLERIREIAVEAGPLTRERALAADRGTSRSA
jgi:hypothetical protein